MCPRVSSVCLATMTEGGEGLGCFGDACQDGPGWVPAAVCSAPWGTLGCSLSRGDGRLRLCGADGAWVPFPVSPAGGAGPRGSGLMESLAPAPGAGHPPAPQAGRHTLRAPWGTSPAPAAHEEEEAYSVVYLSADLRVRVSLTLVLWQPLSSVGRLSGLRVRLGPCWGRLQSVTSMVAGGPELRS